MDNSSTNFKTKKSIYMVLVLFIVLIAFIGISFAWFSWQSSTNSSVTITAGSITVTYNAGNNISGIKLIPVSSKEKGVSDNTAIYKEISASSTETTYFNLNMSLQTLDSGLSHQSLVWEIYTGSTLLNSGNFANSVEGDVINLLEDYTLSTSLTTFKLYIWIDGLQNNPTTMMNQDYTFVLNANASDRRSNLDESGANAPKLVQGLIPVRYDNNNWVKADSTNFDVDNKWYDYDNKMWANAVLVNNDTTNIVDLTDNVSNATVSGATMGDDGLSFDGSDDYVTMPSSLGVSFPATYSITFKTSSTTNQIVFGDYNTRVALGLYQNNNSFIVSLISSTNVVSTGGLELNRFYTVDLVFNSLSDYDVYLDGNKLTKTGSTNYWSWSDTNSYLGKRSSGTYFKGVIKNFEVYNRVLSQNEININLQKQSKTINSNMKVYYDFVNYRNPYDGAIIPEDRILAYYTWIPRYKYKVWNINKIAQAESNYSYSAYTSGIDIKFEKGSATTGTISCNNYSFAAPNSSTPNETCTGSNGDYYTHPAFWWDMDGDSVHDEGEELDGIWVGKFEVSSETPTATDGGGNSASLTVRIKPNTISWRKNTSTNYYKVIYDMQKSSNIYGLSTDRTNTDSHMLKNMEWGAVAYLTNSKYGRCNNNTCTEITINNNSSYYTGGNAYVTNVNQSTTGNIYGIYDISGGAYEYVMGNMSSAAGSYTYYTGSGGSNFSYSASTARHVDRYANGSTTTDQTAFNRARLGDATGEVALTTGSSAAWYGDVSYFVGSSSPWFLRGGRYSNNALAGAFGFSIGSGSVSDYSSRAALIGL